MTNEKNKPTIRVVPSVEQLWYDFNPFTNTDPNLSLCRKDLKEINPDLQAEWERVYREKWIPRAKIAARYYQNISEICDNFDLYNRIIGDINNDRVPPFWSCCDPDIASYQRIAKKNGKEVDPFEVINCSIPMTLKETKNRWGMFVNRNLVSYILRLEKMYSNPKLYFQESKDPWGYKKPSNKKQVDSQFNKG